MRLRNWDLGFGIEELGLRSWELGIEITIAIEIDIEIDIEINSFLTT
ncbi:hypothetical protein ACFQZF_05180 [Flavobacterium myungsuense]|uniref:Uncharacterized protein n=1 Tax=Flavobacterium myungsuense TaxID=651823 RepID=A0ABW3IZ43_9FLAO